MDRTSIIGIGVIILIGFLWIQNSPTFQPPTSENSSQKKAVAKKSFAKEQAPLILSTSQEKKTVAEVSTRSFTPPAHIKNLPNVTFGNKFFIMQIDPETGVLDTTLTQYKDETKQKNFSFLDKNNASLYIYKPQEKWHWGQAKVSHNAKKSTPATWIEVSRPVLNKNFTLVQKWKLKPLSQYEYTYSITFINHTTSQVFSSLRLNCGFVAPMTGANSYMSFADQSVDTAILDDDDIEVATHIFSSFKDDLIELDQNQGFIPGTSKEKLDVDNLPISWVAIKNQYFANIVDSNEGNFTQAFLGYANLQNPEDSNKLISVETSLPNFSLNQGEQKTFTFTCYTGPQKLDLLEALGNQKEKILQFSLLFKWKIAWLGFIAELLLKALNFFYKIVGDYGLAIIALTLAIKGLFWRLTNKANRSMKKMQILAPELKSIREKHKANPQMMQQKTMEIYRKHGVNPVSGCLPILLQMPIYIALFSMIRSAIELRHQSFLWVEDLAQPDTIFSIFGFNVHLLILVWIGLMILHQRMMPNTAEPMQRNMMLIMPVIMLIFCYEAPSALTLYFSIQSLATLIQYKLNNPKVEIIKK